MAGPVKTRIQLKYDTETNWRKAINFRPLLGEVIIYSTDDSHPFFRLKVGDGSTLVNDLPFVRSDEPGIKLETTNFWNLNRTYIPKLGEMIIYADGESYTNNNNQLVVVPKIKIGDGITYVSDLPFLNEKDNVIIQQHISNSDIHITSAQRTFWNNKLNCQSMVVDEALIFNRN